MCGGKACSSDKNGGKPGNNQMQQGKPGEKCGCNCNPMNKDPKAGASCGCKKEQNNSSCCK